MEIASCPLSRIQFRYRSTRLHDLPRLRIELAVEVELKCKTLILKSVQSRAMMLSLWLLQEA